MHKKTLITASVIPNREELYKIYDKIFESGQLTNFGRYHSSFENKLAKYHEIDKALLVNNATNGLLMAVKALKMKKVITTPFSFAATTQVLKFLDVEPVFCDIEANGPNIDPLEIEKKIGQDIDGILAVHCYGLPCNVEAIGEISKSHSIPVIYDAAHATGVIHNNKFLVEYGDISVISLHATKVLNSGEGGAIFSRNEAVFNKLKIMRNFGITGEDLIEGLGINSKMSELHAAIGLLNLKTLDVNILQRKKIASYYLNNIDKSVKCLLNDDNITNASYFPLIFNSQLNRDEVHAALREIDVYSRKYFSPLLTDSFPKISKTDFPNARRLVEQVLCIPIHPNLSEIEMEKIVICINKVTKIH